MPKKLPNMKLSREEERFLRHWMFDEVHFQRGRGAAKQLQVEHRVVPADLATIIAASIPDPAEQLSAGEGPPPSETPVWPWTEEGFRARLAEASSVVARRRA